MESVSNTGRHSFPTCSYLTIFLLPSTIFPIGSLSSCALVGHSGNGTSDLGISGVLVSGTSGAGGPLYAGGFGGSCLNSNLDAS